MMGNLCEYDVFEVRAEDEPPKIDENADNLEHAYCDSVRWLDDLGWL